MAESAKHGLSEKDHKFLQSYGIDANTKIPFFTRKPWVLFVLSLITVGLYDVYWFYKNWQAVQRVTGSKMSPVWRAVLTVIYAWPLFKIMVLQARQRGFTKNYSGGALAAFYILGGYAGAGITREDSSAVTVMGVLFVTTALMVWALVLAQQAAKYSNAEAHIPADTYRKGTKGEWAIVVFGLLFTVLISLALSVPRTVPASQDQVDSAKQRVDNLTAAYNDCSSDLQDRRATIDAADAVAVDTYNTDYDSCEVVRQQQNQAADDYNKLIRGE